MLNLTQMTWLCLLACFPMAFGVLLGAWLSYRTRHDQSPVPTLFGGRIKTVKHETEPKPFTLPEVKA